MIHKISTAGMSREDWLEERRNSVGGSEVGAILGLNNYQSPFSVWANKTGRTADSEPNEAMRQGTDLEEYVAQRFAERSGLKTQRVNYILRNDLYPHIHANLDRRIVGASAGLECKTASALNEKRFAGGDFPLSYYCQCVAYMAVTGYDEYYLAALILGRDFKIYRMTTIPDSPLPEWCDAGVYVSSEEFDAMRDAVIDFWGYVERDEEPPVDGLNATTEALGEVFAAEEDVEADLFGMDQTFISLDYVKDQIKRLKEQQEELENQIKDRLGNAARGSSGRYSCTWKTQQRRTFDAKRFAKDNPQINLDAYYKTSASRVFKYKEEK